MAEQPGEVVVVESSWKAGKATGGLGKQLIVGRGRDEEIAVRMKELSGDVRKRGRSGAEGWQCS